MNFLITLKVALRHLRRTNLRSALTALGIIIGVAAVVAVLSVGNGARAYVEQTLAELESNQLYISGDPKRGQWRPGFRWGLPAGDGLTVGDYLAIKKEIPGVAASTVRVTGTIRRSASSTEHLRILAHGVDVDGLLVLGRRVVHGTNFGQPDVRAAARVCVIPEFLGQAKFGDESPIGRTIHIGDTPFTVVGVMEDEIGFGDRGLTEPGDTTAFVPYTSLIRRLDRTAKISVVVRATDPAELARIQLEVGNLLERRRGNRIAEFNTGNVAEVVRLQTDASRTLTLLLGGIGGVSLLVGGIGIMNIMLVSVTERTREIGVRIAMGTRSRDVMRQFVIESVVLSVCGGAAGVIAGIGITRLIAYLSEWPTLITSSSILLAFLCSAVIGVFFGYYPAERASELNPVDALRAE